MSILRLAALLPLLSCPALAQEYSAVTISKVAVMATASSISEQIGSIPAGTRLEVLACFADADYCAVQSADISGFVAGSELSTASGNLPLPADQARLER